MKRGFTMKKIINYSLFVFIILFSSCEFEETHTKETHTNTTFIEFNNSQGICDVSVYDDPRRRDEDLISKISAGLKETFKWTPSESMPFYFKYHVEVSRIPFDYIPDMGKDQTAVRINPDILTIITIPRLDVSSANKLLSNSCLIMIQNDSSYSFRFRQGSASLTPSNFSLPVVNAGEFAHYSITPGIVSTYNLSSGSQEISFPSSLNGFKAGYAYSFVLYSSGLSFVSETELIMGNISISTVPGTTLANKLSWLESEAQNGETYYIRFNSDANIPSYENKKDITLVLLGNDTMRTINIGRFLINSGTLIFDENITLKGGEIQVNGGNLIMNLNSCIKDGNSSGVFVRSGTFTMTGGTISGNRASYGGGVYVSNGTFTMTGGTISGNRASYGGGVYVSNGTFIKQGTQSGIIYGNNAVGNDENGIPLRNTASSDANGHVVYYSSTSKRNTTVNQSDQINTGTEQGLSASGNAPFGNGIPSTTTSLFEIQWRDGNMTSSSGGEVWYSFTVTSGTTYRVWWDERNQSSGSKTLNISVSAFYSDGTVIFRNIDSAWNEPRTFIASSSGTVYIRVTPYSSGDTGTFGLVYSRGNIRP